MEQQSRSRRSAGTGDIRAVTGEGVRSERQARARTIGAFILVTLIWGSAWLVIKDQISEVPPSWSVTWRFVIAAIGMFALALVRRESLRLSRPAMQLAMVVGLFQFCANFQFVYRAEH